MKIFLKADFHALLLAAAHELQRKSVLNNIRTILPLIYKIYGELEDGEPQNRSSNGLIESSAFSGRGEKRKSPRITEDLWLDGSLACLLSKFDIESDFANPTIIFANIKNRFEFYNELICEIKILRDFFEVSPT